MPGDEELNELVESFPIPGVKLSACRHLENHDNAYLGCGAGDWYVSLDEQGRLRSCSFCPEKMPLENVDYQHIYQHIVEALPHLPRLPCHTRITVGPPGDAEHPRDEGDELDDSERARLHDSLRASAEDVANGRVRPAAEVLAELFGR